jgi:hypothetical protein
LNLLETSQDRVYQWYLVSMRTGERSGPSVEFRRMEDNNAYGAYMLTYRQNIIR